VVPRLGADSGQLVELAVVGLHEQLADCGKFVYVTNAQP
jgi:hypothetical protein